MDLDSLVARPIAGLVAVDDERAPLRVLIASLSPGGAERIVLEWLAAERSRNRPAELAVLHARRNALAAPQGIAVRMRPRTIPVERFVRELAHEWRGHPAPVSTHLVTDDLLALLWSAGVRTVPTVHNAPEGWRNHAAAWRAEHVPAVIACADAVRHELVREGCTVPVVTLRHRPRVAAAAFDIAARDAIRAELRISAGTFLVGAVGAIKPQKDYARAIEVLAALAGRRDAALLILGGVLDRAGLAEIDRVMQRAVDLGVTARLRLPGFVSPIEPWLAACDAVVNVSRFEGLSIAAQEALAAGLPVVATDVGGQDEIGHPALALVGAAESARGIAARLASLPVRGRLEASPFPRAPRAWSLATSARAPTRPRIDTIFVTANLNAGGAQRSLVNLCGAIAGRHRLAVAVCGETTHAAFADSLRGRGVEMFRPAPSPDAFAVAESLLAHAQARAATSLCFWNADPRVKLLAAKFAPRALRLVDVSPGDYAFAEMDATEAFARSVATSPGDFYARLDRLVLKYPSGSHPPCRRVSVIANGVAPAARAPRPDRPRFLVSGRIAPSKRLEDVLAAFALVRRHEPAAGLHVFGVVEERHRGYCASLPFDAPGVALRGAAFDQAYLAEPWTAAVILGTHQGSPNAVLEAMSAAIAVIANDSGGTRELVRPGETGWLLPEAATVEALGRAMLEAAGDPALAAARGEGGRALVRERHAMEQMARRYLEILAPETAVPHEKMAAWNRKIELPHTCALPASNP